MAPGQAAETRKNTKVVTISIKCISGEGPQGKRKGAKKRPEEEVKTEAKSIKKVS